MRTKTSGWLPAVVALAFGGVTASAQVAPGLRTGTTELGLFGGASIGQDQFRAMGGMNISRAVTSWALPYGEFSYFPGVFRTVTTSDNLVKKGSVKIYDMHFGVHLCAPLKEKRVLPYGVFGFGWIRTDGQINSQAIGTVGKGVTESFASNDPAVNFGAGIRHYATDRAGFRVEYKLYRPVRGTFTDFFSKVEGGLFFQF